MNKRPVLSTLAALFVLVGLGQGMSALPGLEAWAMRLNTPQIAQGDASYPSEPAATVAPEGIEVVDAREPAPTPILDEETSLRAQRYDLRQEAERLAEEWSKLDLEKRRLDDRRHQDYQRIAAMYARMQPSKAATVMSSLKASEAAIFIALMPEEDGAEILSLMSPAMAVAITRDLLKHSAPGGELATPPA